MQDQDEELARARLAFVSGGRPPLGAPRRGADQADPEPLANRLPVPAGGVLSRARRAFNWRHLLVVASLLIGAVFVTINLLPRSSATEVPIVSSAAPQSAPTESPSASVAPLRVHVGGAVTKPGVVTVPDGAIVQDAIAAAGGLLPDADPDLLNLAAPLSDGMQILIGTAAQPRGEVAVPAGKGSGGGQSDQLDLNQATAAELETLPGVGPVTAAAIIAWREEHGRFTVVEELQEISGIGPKTLAKLAALVRV